MLTELINMISNMDISLILSIIAIIVAMITGGWSIYLAIKSIRNSERSFRRTTTLQTEIFILGAYKDYMESMYKNVSDEIKNNATTRFLMSIDLYCKYVINGHLDSKLSDDNLNFYRECILIFKDTIKKDLGGYNNIADYANKYDISLD